MTARAKRSRHVALLALGTLLFAAYLVRLDWSSVVESRAGFPLATAVLILSLNLLTGWIKLGRWTYLLRSRGISAVDSRFDEYLAINAGFFLGLVTPGTSGELARGAFSEVEGSRSVAIVGFEKISDLGVLLLMVAGSAVVQLTAGSMSWIASLAILVTTLSAYLLFLQFDRLVTAPFKWLLGRFGSPQQLETARGIYWEFFELLRDRRALLASAGFSVVLWILPVLQMHMILGSAGGHVPLKTSAFVFLFPYLIGILSMIPAGIGVFDLAADQVGGRALELAGAFDAMGSLAPLYFRILVTIPLIVLGYLSQIALGVRRADRVPK